MYNCPILPITYFNFRQNGICVHYSRWNWIRRDGYKLVLALWVHVPVSTLWTIVPTATKLGKEIAKLHNYTFLPVKRLSRKEKA